MQHVHDIGVESTGKDIIDEKKEDESTPSTALPTVHPSPATPGEIVKTDRLSWVNDLPTKKFSEAHQTVLKDLIHTHKVSKLFYFQVCFYLQCTRDTISSCHRKITYLFVVCIIFTHIWTHRNV